jgi:hypothetical protein
MKSAMLRAPILGGFAPASRRAPTIFPNRLLKAAAPMLLACLGLAAHAQTGEWGWMGGTSATNQGGVYGMLGTAATTNVPGAREYASSWIDSSGHLWLFGGFGFQILAGNVDVYQAYLNDLWEFDPSTNKWVWMGGSSTSSELSPYYGSPGVYGTLGTPAATNVPGARGYASSWVDSVGNFWLFGGFGFDANGDFGYLDDLWEFNPPALQWVWMGGSSTIGNNCGSPGGIVSWCGQPGVYGTLGKPAAGNQPGGRYSSSGWTDSNGNLWLFGGAAFDAEGNIGGINDDWLFNPPTNEWSWMGGASAVNQLGVYGTLGTPAAGNIPGSRAGASNWADNSGNLWLFGGGTLFRET